MEPREHHGHRFQRSSADLTARLSGILLPFPTPFDRSDAFDKGALRANFDRWNETGVTGYVALGSTGERVHLDDEERLDVIKTARLATQEHRAFVVGVGQQSTRGTINELRRAADLGADAVLLINPSFYRGAMTTEALYRHFSAVAEVSTVPIILYSIPQNTSIPISPELTARLAPHERIVGIKDSSGDILNLAETLRLTQGGQKDFAVMTGHGGAVYSSLVSGARGGILAAACAVPELYVSVFVAAAGGDHQLALHLQRHVAPLARAVTTLYGIGGLKAAMSHRGFIGGHVRAPLTTPDEQTRREIEELVDRAMASVDSHTL